MKTLLIVAVIVLLFVALVALCNTLRKRMQRNTLATAFKNLEKNPRYQLMMQAMEIMAQGETKDGKIPDSYGEFGYDATNPIPTKGIPGSIAYLAKLRTEKGVKVEYERKGCTHAENIKHPVDMYEIRANGEYVCMLHLCPYYKENSAIAPKGFKVLSLEELLGRRNPISRFGMIEVF